jgi:hypothetical protein
MVRQWRCPRFATFSLPAIPRPGLQEDPADAESEPGGRGLLNGKAVPLLLAGERDGAAGVLVGRYREEQLPQQLTGSGASVGELEPSPHDLPPCVGSGVSLRTTTGAAEHALDADPPRHAVGVHALEQELRRSAPDAE